MTENIKQKCAIIGLIGAPNVGKSTLINSIIGSKISIVSPKVQTTRTVINGITITDECQMIFVDTPGIFSPRATKSLEKAIVKGAWRGVEDVDIYAIIIDVTKGFCKNTELVIEKIRNRGKKMVLLVNKIDLLKKRKNIDFNQIVEKFSSYGVFDKIILTSALKGRGTDTFKEYVIENSPQGPWLYGENDISSVPKKFLISEIVREKLFMRLNQELPYSLTVETEHFEENAKKILNVHQVIYVTKANHKMIILGKQGQMIKKIGQDARFELEKILDQRVNLFLFVKVKENWQEDPDKYSYMGLNL